MPETSRCYHLTTFGCQMNEHDSERIRGVLEEQGWSPADRQEAADLLVFNTCSVRESAESRLLGRLGEARRIKAEKPGTLIALAGCFAQSRQAGIFRDLPFLDISFGPRNIGELPALIDSALTGAGPASCFDDNAEASAGLPARRSEGHRAWVQVMTGCTNNCSYCVVPSVRGPERSRDLGDIVEEVERLVSEGVVEVTLLGQNVNSYGIDLSTAREARAGFADLLARLDAIDGLKRIRFTTSHPKDLGPELIVAIAGLSAVCEHLHLPAQSGSDRVLARMNRGYTRRHYLDLVHDLYEKIPELALTTDIIIGFPGEKEEDFYRTLTMLEEARTDGAFTFIYSERSGTEAAELTGRIPQVTVKRRMHELVELTQRLALEKNELYLGRDVEVMVEGPSRHGGGQLRGRTRQNKIVNFEIAGEVTSAAGKEPPAAGEIVQVTIESVSSTTLAGRA